MNFNCNTKMILSLIFLLIIQTGKILSQTNENFELNFNTRNYDQTHLKLNILFDFDEGAVIGNATIVFKPLIDKFDKLILHAKDMNVSSVKLNRNEIAFSQTDELLTIELGDTFDKDEEVTVTIKYKAYPSSGLFFFKPSDETQSMPLQAWSHGQGEKNRYWYPSYDKPDDRFSSEMIATVPENLTVISNGVLVSNFINKEGTYTYHWSMEEDHPGYLTSIIVGNFNTFVDTVRGTVLEYNLPSDVTSDHNLVFRRTPNMLNFFSDYILPYPYKRFAQTAVQDFLYGGMENITLVTLNKRIFNIENALPNYSPDGLIAHEFVHQWFGNMITCRDWNDIWLNEGLATYFTQLYFEHEKGFDEFVYRLYSHQKKIVSSSTQEKLIKLEPQYESFLPLELQGETAYIKGSAILNMLRFELGDEIFKKGIQHYVTKHAHQSIATEDFRIAMEEICGKDLRRFFHQWLYGAGFPELDVSYNWYSKTKNVELTVVQTQREMPAVGLFDFPVEIGIIAGVNRIKQNIRVKKREETFNISVPIKPTLVRFDKYSRILKRMNFKKSFNELTYQLLFDDDVSGRIRAAEELIKFGDRAVGSLHRAAQHDNFYAVRIKSIEVLDSINSQDDFEFLVHKTNDEDPRVSESAARSLSRFKTVKCLDTLEYLFENDKNDYVRAAAIKSIGKLNFPGVYEYLEEGLKFGSHNNVIRKNIFEAFDELGDPRALSLVKEYIQYKYSNGGMHLHDIAALNYAASVKDKNREAIEIIASALYNPYFRTRKHAANLLVNLGANHKLPLLRYIYKNERREDVRKTLKSAIKKLEGVYEN